MFLRVVEMKNGALRLAGVMPGPDERLQNWKSSALMSALSIRLRTSICTLKNPALPTRKILRLFPVKTL